MNRRTRWSGIPGKAAALTIEDMSDGAIVLATNLWVAANGVQNPLNDLVVNLMEFFLPAGRVRLSVRVLRFRANAGIGLGDGLFGDATFEEELHSFGQAAKGLAGDIYSSEYTLVFGEQSE